MMNSCVLVTGGAGFIGSHTSLVLLEKGYELVVLDNFENSSPEALKRVCELTGSDKIELVEGDVRNQTDVDLALKKAGQCDGVIHFAGLKAVGESVVDPLRYWDINVNGTRVLAARMEEHGCRTLVFSSTSTAYGEPDMFPLNENMPTNPIHPYAQTKVAVEQMLNALCQSLQWKVINLRYFNPVGAHPSGRIGEDPLGTPNNLFPYITQVAAGRREKLKIYGDNYKTIDGTGIRDYLHVMDLAEAHERALLHLKNQRPNYSNTINIGTGQSLSVMEVIKGFETSTGVSIPYEIVSRRDGDVDKLEACPRKAEQVLGWKATRSLNDMCNDGWTWQKNNPHGYRGNQT